MSEGPPFTVFSATLAPERVVHALERAGARVKYVEGSGANWRSLEARWANSPPLIVNHSPEYYADASFSKQLPGMFGMFLRAGAPLPVLTMIRSFRFSVSLIPEGGFEDGDPRFAGVEAVCSALDGAVFLPDGFRDARGLMLFGRDGEGDADAQFPRETSPNPILVPRGGLYEPASASRLRNPALRNASCEVLKRVGFAAPYGLPQKTDAKLRPLREVASRLLALRALFAFVARPQVKEEALRDAIARDGLNAALVEREQEILKLPREQANEQWSNAIGWRLENMWSLAWVLGYEQPGLVDGMIDGPRIREVLERFLPPLEVNASSWLARCSPRSEAEVVQLEDVFYCAHHAVRSAQMARVTVPPDFHPMRDGGCVHERRHSLTWAVSPGVAWDETDLST